MLDHVFLTVSDMKRSILFYEAVLAPLGIDERFDFDGRVGHRATPTSKASVQTVACSFGFVKV